MGRLILLLCIGIFLCSCGKNPDVSIHYYLSKTEVTVRVIRTVTCDEGDQIFTASNATIIPNHFADLNNSRTLNISQLDSLFSNSDVSFNFYDDGRLKGINATNTGQGEAILKSVVSLVASVSALDLDEKYTEECEYINGGKNTRDKSVTLTYEGLVTLTKGTETDVAIKPEDTVHFEKLGHVLGSVNVLVESVQTTTPPLSRNDLDSDDVLLKLRQPAQASLVISAGRGGIHDESELSRGVVAVGHLGTEYFVPIPRPAVFGKQEFSITVEPAGTATLLRYGNETGVAQLLAVGTAISNELREPTTAERVAEIKAEADLIAQQQRLVRCRADPDTCN